MRRSIAAVAAVALAGLLGTVTLTAGAADDPEAVIKQRRELMKANGGDMKAINDALQAGDVAKIPDIATHLREDAEKIPGLFPEGTSLDQFPGKTGAKPAIWTEHDKFLAAAKTLEAETDKFLEVAKGGDATAIAAAFDTLGKTGCGTCHQSFRQKLE